MAFIGIRFVAAYSTKVNSKPNLIVRTWIHSLKITRCMFLLSSCNGSVHQPDLMCLCALTLCMCVRESACAPLNNSRGCKDDSESLVHLHISFCFILLLAKPLSLMRNRRPHGSVSNTQTEHIPWARLLKNRSHQIGDPIIFQIQYYRPTESCRLGKMLWMFYFFIYFLVGNTRLLTLPWCAVKQHLISLNNFSNYDALSATNVRFFGFTLGKSGSQF